MDYKFLDKVVEQILSETKVDYVRRGYYVNYPYHSNSSISISQNIPSYSFPKHCKEIYGLKEQEIRYVWEQYLTIVRHNINLIVNNE